MFDPPCTPQLQYYRLDCQIRRPAHASARTPRRSGQTRSSKLVWARRPSCCETEGTDGRHHDDEVLDDHTQSLTHTHTHSRTHTHTHAHTHTHTCFTWPTANDEKNLIYNILNRQRPRGHRIPVRREKCTCDGTKNNSTPGSSWFGKQHPGDASGCAQW